MTTITFRADSQVEAALAELLKDGKDRSTVIREAILDAEWHHRQASLRADAARVMADPHDVAESQAILREMEAIDAG
jgi:predicted transcriptional regulator